MLRSYRLVGPEQGKYFSVCKKELLKNTKRLETSELYTLSHYLLNFCIKKINTGEGQYYKEIFELYQVLLEEKNILRNGQVSQWTFRNAITSGIRLREFEWTEGFIRRYRENLPPAEQETAVAFNLALPHLARDDYDGALRSLLDVEFSDSYY